MIIIYGFIALGIIIGLIGILTDLVFFILDKIKSRS